MISLKRPVLALGAAALMTVSLTACGGGASSAPKSASTADFCSTWNGLKDDIDSKASEDKQADQAHKVADKLKKTGTPKGLSADERKGFEVFTDALADISGGDIKKLEGDSSSDGPWSKDDNKKVEAFLLFEAKTCSGSASQ